MGNLQAFFQAFPRSNFVHIPLATAVTPPSLQQNGRGLQRAKGMGTGSPLNWGVPQYVTNKVGRAQWPFRHTWGGLRLNVGWSQKPWEQVALSEAQEHGV